MKTFQSSIKQNTQPRERQEVQNGKTQVLANEESSKEGGLLGELEQIKHMCEV
jgi:hypothetical protein